MGRDIIVTVKIFNKDGTLKEEREVKARLIIDHSIYSIVFDEKMVFLRGERVKYEYLFTV